MTYSINSSASAASLSFSSSSFNNSQMQAMNLDSTTQETDAAISNLTSPFSPPPPSVCETAAADAFLNSLISSSSSMSSFVSSSSFSPSYASSSSSSFSVFPLPPSQTSASENALSDLFKSTIFTSMPSYVSSSSFSPSSASSSSSSFSGFPSFPLGSSSSFNSSSVFSAFLPCSSFRSISSQNSAFSPSKKILKAKRCEERTKILNMSNIQNNNPVKFSYLKNKYKASFEHARALEKEKTKKDFIPNFEKISKLLDEAIDESTECEKFLEANAKASLSSLNFSEEMGNILFDRGNMYLMQGGDLLDLSENDLEEASQLFAVASNAAKINECTALIKIVQEKKALFAKDKQDADVFLTTVFDKMHLNDMQMS